MGCVPVSPTRRSAGFTLLELMVVLVLIGIIFSFAVLSLGGDDYAELMEDLKLEMRVQEDITDKFRPMITQSWTGFVESLEKGNVSPERAEALIQEAEMWTRRVAALDSGDLRVCRIHAILKDSGKLLSDW